MKSQNKAGTWFKIILLENGNFLVCKLCENYAGHVRGGIVKTWRICTTHPRQSAKEFDIMARNGLARAEAFDLYNKKIGGKQKP
tara:strand:- start:721 stop:972 length:252 start_codon:yes stop_codon:yes gene_type:complete